MEMATVGWVAIGWFAVALIVSLGLGRILRQANVTDDDLAMAASKRKVMRYMRVRGAKPVIAANTVAVKTRATGKHAVKASG